MYAHAWLACYLYMYQSTSVKGVDFIDYYFKIKDMLFCMAISFLYVFDLRNFFIIWILPQEFRENQIWIILCNIQRTNSMKLYINIRNQYQ